MGLAAALLVLCVQGARGGATTITFSEALAPAEVPAMLKLLDRFQSETGIKVDLVTVNSKDLANRLKADREAGRATIHLFAQDNPELYPLADNDLVADLTYDIDLRRDLGIATTDPPDPRPGEGARHVGAENLGLPILLDGSEFGPGLHFLPFRTNVQLLYINKKAALGDKMPENIGELLSMAERLRQTPKAGSFTLSLGGGPPAQVTISELIRTEGGDPLRLNDDLSVRALLDLQSMLKNGSLSNNSTNANFDTEVDYLNDGSSWMAQNWPFTSAIFAQQGTLKNFRVLSGWAKNQVHVIGGDTLGIPKFLQDNRRSKDKYQWLAAVALAKFLVSKDSQLFLAHENGWLPIRDDAYQEARKGELGETLEAAHDAAHSERVWRRPNTPEWEQATCAIDEARKQILLGDGLKKTEPDVRAILNQLSAQVAAKTACAQLG